jgi:hypothetical protein
MRAAAENILHDRLKECLSRLSYGEACLHCGDTQAELANAEDP